MSGSTDSYIRRAIPGGEVQIFLGAEEDALTVQNCDGFVIDEHGQRHTFTALTLAEVGRIMDRHARSGENDSGAHLRVPDLVLLRSGGVDGIVAAVSDLFEGLPTVD